MDRKQLHRKTLQRLHARRRARERYDLELTNADITRIVGAIRHGESVSTKKLTNTRTLHVVNFNEQMMRVIYDNKRHNVCTFLPLLNK
ncbi:MAG: hypothetical protein WC554_09270 [Clostridia bacterium]